MKGYGYHPKLAVSAVLVVIGILCGGFSLAEDRSLVEHFEVMTSNDAEVFECVACHDCVIAKMGDFQLFRIGEKINPLGSHPVNIDYPSTLSEGRHYEEISAVAGAGLRLRDGKVVCTTCHDLRLGTDLYLAVTMNNSKLCFSCHRK